jgi:pimeloyl-ACP methyl ester carboxylesterase
MARSPFGPNPHPDHVRLTLAMAAAAAPATVSAATVGNITYDVRSALGAIDLPSLVIRGSRDTLSTERSTAQLSAALARPEVVVFDGCGHLPMFEDRERFTATLRTFARRVTATS